MNFCLIFLRVLCLNSKSNLALDFQLAGFHLSVQSSRAVSQSGTSFALLFMGQIILNLLLALLPSRCVDGGGLSWQSSSLPSPSH